MAIKHIIFDFGNVLVTFRPRDYIEKVFTEQGDRDAVFNLLFNSVTWLQLDKGVLPLAEARQIILDKMPQKLKEGTAFLFDNWYKDLAPVSGMEALVGELGEEGYTLYLLSNIAESFKLYCDNVPVLRHIHHKYLSFEKHLIKPDSRVYLDFFREYNLNPSECYYVDDWPYNVEMATALGIPSFLFTDDAEALKKDMREKGIRI